MSETYKERKFDLMCKALDIESDSDMIKTIVENVGNITVNDIQETKGAYEIFAKPTGITGKELRNLQELFKFKEIGIYGHTDIPDENVYLYMYLYVSNDE